MSFVPTWGPGGKIEEGGASKPLSQHLSETITGLASGAVPVAASGVRIAERKTAVDTTLLVTDRRVVACPGCAQILTPVVGTLGDGYECTIVNDTGGQLTINGPGATNIVIEDGDIAAVLETNGKQRVAFGYSTVIS